MVGLLVFELIVLCGSFLLVEIMLKLDLVKIVEWGLFCVILFGLFVWLCNLVGFGKFECELLFVVFLRFLELFCDVECLDE